MHRMAYSTQFLIPALLNPMINKMANKASAILLLICSHEFWVKVSYDWSTALCSCLWLWWPRFYKLKLRHKHEHKKNQLVHFSYAYVYAYVDPVFTCLHMCLCLCSGENQWWCSMINLLNRNHILKSMLYNSVLFFWLLNVTSWTLRAESPSIFLVRLCLLAE